MINTIRRTLPTADWRVWAIIFAVLLGSAFAGFRVSIAWYALLAVCIGAVILLRQPILGFFALIAAALVIPFEFSTGTEVNVNTATLLVPVLLVIWLLNSLSRQDLRLAPSRTNRPLVLFLLLGLLSILISNVIWDPSVPKSDRFIIVQLAQWGIFAFSAGIYWLVGNWAVNTTWLRRITACFLIIGGSIAIMRVLPGGESILSGFATFTFNRAPFWLMLTAVAGGQLLFNQKLSLGWRLFLLAILGATMYFSVAVQQERSSNWVGVGAAVGILIWLRFPRIRRPILIALLVLTLSGTLLQKIYEFAGGDAKWTESGASRGALIARVIELSMRNPITGIGPAAYRPYGFTRPLFYGGAYWVEPRINSHNNYVDLFSQVGVLGLGLFLWFMAEVAWLGWRLRKTFTEGFAAGYVNGMLGAWVGIMLLMALADWFLPFVYNIGFLGFQASVLAWMFFGGLISLDQIARTPAALPQGVPELSQRRT